MRQLQRIATSWTLTVLLTGILLAGCVGGDPESASDDGEQLEETTKDTLGTIEGTVTDSEGLPVAGARLALVPSDRTAETLPNGTYRFANVEPGDYRLFAEKLGFDSKAFVVTVDAGSTVRKDLSLEKLVVVESYQYTEPYAGVLECSLATPVWVSPCDYPYTAVYYTALGAGVNLSQYGLPSEPLANQWRYSLTVLENSTGIISELAWEPVSDASRNMMLAVSCDEYDPVIDDCDGWGSLDDGESPVRIDWEFPDSEEDPTMMTRVYLPWGDPQVAVGQRFEVYHTMFYGEDAPGLDEFSALPPE